MTDSLSHGKLEHIKVNRKFSKSWRVVEVDKLLIKPMRFGSSLSSGFFEKHDK